MTNSIRIAAMAALFLPFAATFAMAGGPIEKACLQSDRAAATRATCGCIQQVADSTLTGSDQRRAAKFFTDPDKAQEVRLSTRSSDDAFWTRYQEFGEAAAASCGG